MSALTYSNGRPTGAIVARSGAEKASVVQSLVVKLKGEARDHRSDLSRSRFADAVRGTSFLVH